MWEKFVEIGEQKGFFMPAEESNEGVASEPRQPEQRSRVLFERKSSGKATDAADWRANPEAEEGN